MRKLYKFYVFLIIFFPFGIWHLAFNIPTTAAQVPEINLACSETGSPEFHSLRPYQAAPCGEAPVARFCSNKLVVLEEFNMAGACEEQRHHKTGSWTCKVPDDKGYIKPHNLNITLDESDFPIMGNTEDEFDDATKMNDYASWYLSGTTDKKENTEVTDDQVINFSGPIKKLLPSMIQDQQRINIIKTPLTPVSVTEEDDGSSTRDMENHDQDVVGNLKLTDWYGNLSFVRSATNIVGNIVSYLLQAEGIEYPIGGWNHAFPPLPWDDGTGTLDTSTNKWLPGKPFESQMLYQKAYNEWQGKSCAIAPVVGLVCLDNPLITNKFADLWHFVPLSNNSDKKGKNYLLTGDGPNYVPYVGTEITGQQHKSYMNAPLYFPHTEEVKGLSGLLNDIIQPEGYKEEGLGYPDDVEKIKIGIGPSPSPAPVTLSPDKQGIINSTDPYDHLQCSNVNVRVNKGDYLYPGNRDEEGKDSKELYVEGVEYTITQVECDEVWEKVPRECKIGEIGNGHGDCFDFVDSLICTAGVGIEFKLGTKTPWVDEIFKNTVAGTGSTFRKIFPKVEEGAPVECIADIPTVTKVKYNNKNDFNEKPQKGTQSNVLVTNYPDDGAGGTQLTFPHVGSVYEYFLNGIQTALRPKGYGGTIANGNCTPSTPVSCSEWEEKLEDSGGECGVCTSGLGNLAKKILATAGKQYNVPAASIWAAMKHEGGDWDEFRGQFTDENVRKWSTPIACGGEAMPGCNIEDKTSSKAYAPFGHLPYWFYKSEGDNALWSAVSEFDPTRNSTETVSHCNFMDAAFAAAKNLAIWSGFARTPPFCYKLNLGMSDKPASCGDWKDYNIVQSHVGYWIGITPWCPDGTGGPVPSELGSNTALPNYARDVLSNFKSAKCN